MPLDRVQLGYTNGVNPHLHGISGAELMIVLAIAVLLFGGRRPRPRRPSHPLPSNDSELLTRPNRRRGSGLL